MQNPDNVDARCSTLSNLTGDHTHRTICTLKYRIRGSLSCAARMSNGCVCFVTRNLSSTCTLVSSAAQTFNPPAFQVTMPGGLNPPGPSSPWLHCPCPRRFPVDDSQDPIEQLADAAYSSELSRRSGRSDGTLQQRLRTSHGRAGTHVGSAVFSVLQVWPAQC